MLLLSVFAQEDPITDVRRELFYSEIYPESYDDTLMRDAILYHINNENEKQGVRQLRGTKVLEYTAIDLVDYMSKRETTRLSDIPARRKIDRRLYEYEAGNRDSDEILYKALIAKGKTLLTYDEVAQEVAFKLFTKNTREILVNPRYIFIGIGTQLNEDGKKVYICLTFGNYNLISMDKKEIKEKELPITLSYQGLMPKDERTCKSCDNYPNIYSLNDFISVDKNEIYFETEDFKELRKIIKYPKDGLAIDIVMWEQFPCDEKNIVNKIFLSKGHMTKPVYVEDFLKENEYLGRQGKTKLKIKLGEIPEGVKDYELNLVIIKDKHVCANLIPPYNRVVTSTGMPEVAAHPDTISKFNTYNFIPRADTAVIKFRIPFEIGKSEYNKEDIKAFVDSLNQPNFNALSFKISAYSSIDGDPTKNMKLRGARVNSIMKALNEYSNSTAPVTTQNSDSWELFYNDIIGTDFQFLKPQTKDEVLDYLSKGDNKKMLEPILAKHRFAEIEITVKYDISTIYKEQEYVLYLFHKALKEYRDDDALAIQKYIIQQVLSRRYTSLTIDKMDIPNRNAYAGMMMNKTWLHYTARAIPIDAAFLIEMKRLYRMAPNNMYILRNLIFARLQLEEIDGDYYVIEMQNEIDDLMISYLPKYVVDPINLQLQVKALESLNKTFKVSNDEEFINECFERIKGIIEIDKNDWKGAYNLAILFTRMGDYKYPLEVMAPMIHNPEIDEDFIFLFLSICTHSDYMHHTELFEQALSRAREINQEKLCELIDTGKISFQIFENPRVKSFHCKVCGKQAN